MKLKLVELTPAYRPQLEEMMAEWLAAEKPEDVTPWAIVRADYRDFDRYRASLNIETGDETHVPDRTFFCLDEDTGRFVGAVNLRLRLNRRLLEQGGHIGDGIRPSLRGQGYGTRMLALALEKCRELGIYHVLMVCDKDNPASARVIRKNGGVLENEPVVDGCIIQRYWIDLDKGEGQ